MSVNGIEAEGEEYSTPNWDNFNVQMKDVLAHTKSETDKAEATLSGDHTETDLRFLKRIMDTLEAEFAQYVNQYRSIRSEEYVEDDEGLYSDLRGAINCIVAVLIKIETELGPSQPPPPNVDNSGAAALAAFMQVAN